MTTQIRQATTADIPGITRVTENAWRSAYSDIFAPDTIERTLQELREGDRTRKLISREDAPFLVAELTESIVGFVSGIPQYEGVVMRLGALYVDPDHWNAGIGTELLNEFESICRARGAEEIEFEVLAENEVGMGFYRKHGYPIVEEMTTDRFGETALVSVFRRELG